MFIPEARVAKDYFAHAFYERHFIDMACQQLVKEDKKCIDIGAHIGWYTVELAEKCRHVYAFECSPKSFNFLCANIALNGVDYKVTKYNCALSNKEETVAYYVRDPKDGGSNGISQFECDITNKTPSLEVPSKTLDSFNLNDIGFIKIDVEGHEKSVLEGAVETLKRNNYPPILFESWSSEKESQGYPSVRLRNELFNFIMSLGYNITQVGNEEFVAQRK